MTEAGVRRMYFEASLTDAAAVARTLCGASPNGGLVSDPVEALVLDLLEWIGREPRPYSEVIEAWRTSCPRLPVWEEANGRGFVERRHRAGSEALVQVSASGMAFLRAHRAFGSSADRAS